MSDVSQWATSAASNNSSPPDGWPEAQAPSTVNDCGREMMAAIARLYGDIDGTLETGGSGNSYTITSTQTHAALADQSILVFRVDRANTGAATLNVDGLGAKSMRVNGTALASGQLVADKIVIAAYNATDDAYDLIGAIQSAADLVGELDDARLSSNVPLLDAENEFTATGINGAVSLVAAQPVLRLSETGVTSDNGEWILQANAEKLLLSAYDDALSASAHFLVVDRTGTTVDEIELNATTFDLNGALDLSGNATVGGTLGVTGAATFTVRPAISGEGGMLFLTQSGNEGGAVTVSTSDPSGTPADGDIWIKRES